MNSIIVILFPFYKWPENVFCRQDQKYTGNKAINGIKAKPFFPGKIGVFKNKGLQGQKQDQTTKKSVQDFLDILRVVKNMFFIRSHYIAHSYKFNVLAMP